MGRIVVALIAASLLTAPAAAEIGTVKKAIGTATVLRGTVVLPAMPGTKLDVGDTLVTGKDGRIAVTFIDNARFALGPNSRVVVNRFEFDDASHQGRFDAKVLKGQLAVISGQIAHENPKGMTLQTPTSVLGIRGTRFVVAVR